MLWFIKFLTCLCYFSETVELFTFVLTNQDAKFTFGYCRHPPGSKSCVLFLTFLPWQEIFYRSLNFLAELEDDSKLVGFLEQMYSLPIPEAGTCLYVQTHAKPFICPCPSDLSLPSIPENVSQNEYHESLNMLIATLWDFAHLNNYVAEKCQWVL